MNDPGGAQTLTQDPQGSPLLKVEGDAMSEAVAKRNGPDQMVLNTAEIERCAALGMTMPQIADGLGISERTLHNRKSDNTAVRAAYKRGRFTAQQNVLAQLDGHAEKNPIVAIFRGKHILGWHDNVGTAAQGVQSIKVTVEIGGQGVTVEAGSEAPVDTIEAEFEEVE